MKYFKFILIMLMLSLPVAYAQELKLSGTVEKVLKSSVKISVSKIETISKNDKVFIYHKTSSGIKIKVGEWIVVKKDKHFVYAKPVDIIQNARKGQVVDIFSLKKKKNNITLLSKTYDGPTDPIEQNSLGWKYQKGIGGVTKDYKKAAYWYRKSAMQGHAHAQSNMGWIYQHGIGVKKDLAKAVYWYNKGAVNGYASAQANLGWMFQNGIGTKKDYKKALYWYKKAAKQGHANSQNSIGAMYANGQGVKRNMQTAIYWYKNAARRGSQTAKNNLTSIGESW